MYVLNNTWQSQRVKDSGVMSTMSMSNKRLNAKSCRPWTLFLNRDHWKGKLLATLPQNKRHYSQSSAKVKVWEVVQMGHMQQVPRKQIYAKRVLERNREAGRPVLLKAMTSRRITRTPLPHLMHTQCPACASKGDGGFYQGAWNTSLSINQEQRWVRVKAHICTCQQKEGSQQKPGSALTLQQHHPCVSHPRLVPVSRRADHNLAAIQSVPACRTTAGNTSVSHSSGWKVKALNLVKRREPQGQKSHKQVGNLVWNSLGSSYSTKYAHFNCIWYC